MQQNVMFNQMVPAYAGAITESLRHLAPHLPAEDYKYADIDYVRPLVSDEMQYILGRAPIKGRHNRVLVDIKVQDLVPSRTSCIPGWHLDGPENPLHDSLPEEHHLLVVDDGDGSGCTEFVGTPLCLTASPDDPQRKIAAQIPINVSVYAISAGGYNSFTRFDFHRGVNVSKPLRRLLVRVTETNVIKPFNRPAKPGVGARK